jgi:hypothetical protein
MASPLKLLKDIKRRRGTFPPLAAHVAPSTAAQ